MKKIFWIILTLAVVMSFGSMAAVADTQGDVYEFNPQGWPNRHWIFMNDAEIAAYEAAGWQRYTGVLWYDANYNATDYQALNDEMIQELYNQGSSFHVIYHWICPGERLGKNQEQSFYAGRWKLSPAQTMEYYKTCQVPMIQPQGNKEVRYYTTWFYDRKECDEPSGNEGEIELTKYAMIRYNFDAYLMGYGSELYLRNGWYEPYTYQQALDSGGFDNEIIHWN